MTPLEEVRAKRKYERDTEKLINKVEKDVVAWIKDNIDSAFVGHINVSDGVIYTKKKRWFWFDERETDLSKLHITVSLAQKYYDRRVYTIHYHKDTKEFEFIEEYLESYCYSD